MSNIVIDKREDPLAKLPALAKRLGVEPMDSKASGWYVTGGGSTYDMFDLINAVLDKVEAALPKASGGDVDIARPIERPPWAK